MDYEKIHKETLEGLKRLVSEGNITEEVAKKICPDFVMESEDERIRKNLIELLLDTPVQDIISHHLELSKVIAYLEKQKEQKYTNSEKPKEWSEEEERHLYNAIEAVKYVYDISKGTNGFKCVEFLKSFRPPVKDREMKLKILKYLSTRCSSLEFEEVEDYLNSLRPLWKPSEEQMVALKNTMYDYKDAPYFQDLKYLYDALKKLLL